MKFSFAKFKNYQIFLVFLLLSLVVFASSLKIGFLSDDWHWLWLAKNTTWSWQIFLSNYEGGNFGGSYNPVLLLLFKISYLLFGQNAFFYHFLSLIVHSFNALLVYLLATKFFVLLKIKDFKKFSILSALLFLLWPSQVE
ncbi:hypothetical protein H6761_04315, partial [Candidatus Nomurabacteria bacterium]|nr:hypothetical protein [Candidatus Nomurabacteria bacterium]